MLEMWEVVFNSEVSDEVSFVDGMEEGLSRSWSKTGALVAEHNFFMNCGHGFLREWYENGQLKSERKSELGVTLSYREWSEDGKLIKEEILKDDDLEQDHLRALREHFASKLVARNIPVVLP